MPETDDQIVLPVTLNDDQAKAMWEELKRRFKNDPIRPEVIPPDPAAEKGMRSLADVLMHHRAEMRRESGITKVLARDLSMLGLEAKGAGAEIGHLIAGFAFGGGLGLAMAGVKLLAHHFDEIKDYITGVTEEEKKAKEALGDWFKEMTQGHARAVAEIQDLADKLAGLSPVQKLAREQGVVAAQIGELQGKIGSLFDKIDEEKDVSIVGKLRTDKAKEDIASLTQQLTALLQKRDDLSRQASLTVSNEEKERREKDEKQTAEALAKFQADALSVRNQVALEGLSEREKIDREHYANLAKFAGADALTRLAIEQHYFNQLGELSSKENAAREAAQEKRDKEDGEQALKLIHAAQKRETQILEVEQYYDTLREVGGDEQKAKELVANEKHFGELELLFADNEEYLTQIKAEHAKKRAEILAGEMKKEEAAVTLEGLLLRDAQMAVDRFAHSIGSQFSSLANHAGAYQRALEATGQAHKTTAAEAEGAMLKEVQAIVGGIADQAAVRAVLELGLGIATSFTNPPESATHFAAAGVLAGVAGVAAGIGYGVGEARPMTADERAQVASGKGSGAVATGPETLGARGAGAQGQAGGVVRETVILVASPFETPQETARRAARTIAEAKRLDLLARGDV